MLMIFLIFMLLLLFDIPQPVSPARRTQITSTTTDNINKSKHKSLRICFEHLINLTQRCANPNMLYASTMGYGSGLGSEFNAYLLKCVLYAVITNRRFVYLNTKRKWEYNCHEQSGWSCYFGFPSCSDNIANISQINLSLTPTNNTKHFYEQPGSTYIDREEIENFDFQQESFHYFIRRLVEVYNTSLPPNICTFAEEQIFYPAEVAGPISKHLFHLNNKTSHAVKVINHKYEHIARKPYIGMLMRLTDKSGEMPKEDWEMLSNMSFIADRLITAWHNHTIKFNLGTNVLHDVYVATDDCTAASDLSKILIPKGFRFYGSCFQLDGISMNEEKLKKHWNPRGDIHGHEENSTQLLLAELDLLRKSTLFLGSLHSNLGRALTYLRYQHIDSTIPLLPQMSIWRLDQLPFYF